MMMISPPSNHILFLYLLIYVVNETFSVEVTLLTTDGVTTDLGWDVHNLNAEPDFTGWEDLSILYKNKTVRGFQVCQISSEQMDKPESWLLVPGINVNGASRIFIEMNFTMRECSELENTCRETFSVFYRVTDATLANLPQTKLFNPVYYEKIDTVAAEVRFSSKSDSWNLLTNKETVSVSLRKSTENTVFHIAIVDVGACMALMGVRVYHRVCPRVTAGLAIFQETQTGRSDTSLVPIIGKCIPNAIYPEPASTSSESSMTFDLNSDSEMSGPLYRCTSSGEWQVQTGKCLCLAGYEPDRTVTKCLPCASGNHKSSVGNGNCLVCPVHSNTALIGAISCQCDDGFFQTFDQPGLEKNSHSDYECNLCSKLPSPPTNLKITQLDRKNPGFIQLSWNRPHDNGGCYNIKYCVICRAALRSDSNHTDIKGNLDCSHLVFEPSPCQIRRLKVTINKLRGHVSYKFTIVSYSLVSIEKYPEVFEKMKFSLRKDETFTKSQTTFSTSNQVLDTSSAFISLSTNDTLPSSVEGVTLLFGNQTSIAIKWTEPELPNGRILYYEVSWTLVLDDEDFIGEQHHHSLYSDWTKMIVNETSAVLTQLFPGSTYGIIIRVYNSAGSDNGSKVLRASTSPDESSTTDSIVDSNNHPYIIAIIVIASLVFLIFLVLLIQWKLRKKNSKTKFQYRNGRLAKHKEFRPFNAQHETIDQRTYVDPFLLDVVSPHRFLCETSPESIVCESVIGCGEFGEVFKGSLATIDLKTGQETTIEVAVKKLRTQCDPNEQINFLREAQSLERFRHPNIVHLEAVVTKSRPFFIVTELMEHGSLHGFLLGLREKAEEESNGRGWTPSLSAFAMTKMLRGVAMGMEHLIGRGYVHRDLAARNVLVNCDLVCKVADFGSMREIDNEAIDGGTINENGTSTVRGGKIAIRWTAPEAMTFRIYTEFSDIWSFGILMWEAASYSEKPYWDLTNHEVLKAVNDGFRLPAPEGCPSVFHQLMLECWHENYKSRPTFTKIISQFNQMLSNSDILLIPASPASTGVDSVFFTNDVITPPPTPPEVSNRPVFDHKMEPREPLLTTVVVDRHNYDPTLNELEERSEVSSCTSTICASEVTVCPSNNVVVYVPLVRSNSDEINDMVDYRRMVR